MYGDVYTEPAEASLELARRRQDGALCDRVEQFLGDLPAIWPDPSLPIGFLPRQIATCRREDILFAELAAGHGFVPWWFEYTKDKFVTANPDKVGYVNLRNDQKQRFRVAENLPAWEMQPLHAVTTVWGERLPEMHHRMRRAVLPSQLTDNHRDLSDWAIERSGGQGPTGYYPYLMALCVINGVMFEDFHSGPNAHKIAFFLEKNLYPAIAKVKAHIGVRPLIVRLKWEENLALYSDRAIQVAQSFRPAPD